MLQCAKGFYLAATSRRGLVERHCGVQRNTEAAGAMIAALVRLDDQRPPLLILDGEQALEALVLAHHLCRVAVGTNEAEDPAVGRLGFGPAPA
jgi:hypothetical protein